MKNKTRIDKQLKRKTNPSLVETILNAKKKEKWLGVASILSGPRKNILNLNLDELDSKIENGEVVVVPGKILSKGNLTKKITLIAFNFSEKAREKLLNSKTSFSTILEEIKKNPDAKGLKILLK